MIKIFSTYTCPNVEGEYSEFAFHYDDINNKIFYYQVEKNSRFESTVADKKYLSFIESLDFLNEIYDQKVSIEIINYIKRNIIIDSLIYNE